MIRSNPDSLSNFGSSIRSDSNASSLPFQWATLEKRDMKIGSGGINVVDLLRYDVGNYILKKHLFSRDIKSLKEVCTGLYAMLFQKGFFNLKVISAAFKSIQPVLQDPFVSYLVKKNLKPVSKGPFRQLNRYRVYEKFVKHTFITQVQKALLSEKLQKQLQGSYPSLIASYEAFASEVAFRAFRKGETTILRQELAEQTTSEWIRLKEHIEEDCRKGIELQEQRLMEEKLNESIEEAQNRLKRQILLKNYVTMIHNLIELFESGLPLSSKGHGEEQKYEFDRKSLFEYFVAKRLIMLKDSGSVIEDGIRLLRGCPIQEEKEVLKFFEEGWGEEEVSQLKEPFFEIIKASRNNSSKEQIQASANAATLLAAAHVPFSGRDLSGVRIKGADLSNAVFNYTCLYKADLQDVVLYRVWLGSADLREANLLGVDFGEFPSLQCESKSHCVSYNKDEMQMAVGLENGDIKIYIRQEETYKHTTTLKGHKASVLAVTYSPDGKQLASGGGCYGKEGELWIWDTGSFQAITQLKGHSASVLSVTYSPDGKQIASANEDGTIGIWDPITLQAVTQLKGSSGYVYSVAYSPDGKQLASADMGKTIKIWDTISLQLVAQLKGHKDSVHSVTYSPDGKQLISGGGSDYGKGELWIWDTVSFQAITHLNGHTQSVRSVTYSPDGKQFASGGGNDNGYRIGELWIWDTRSLQAITQLKVPTDSIRSVAYSPDGKQLALASWDTTVRILDTGSIQSVAQLKGHADNVRSVTYSPDGKRLASGSSDNTIWIWDTGNLQVVTQLKGHTGNVNSVAYSPDGKRLASGSFDNTIWIWDTVRLEAVTQGHIDGILSVAYSPDGKQIASGSKNETVGIWDSVNLQAITQLKLKRYSSWAHSVAYSPDGKQIASVDHNTIMIWDTETLQEVTQLKGSTRNKQNRHFEALNISNGHNGRIYSVAYSPDGKQLASGGDLTHGRGGELWIWDIGSFNAVTNLKGLKATVKSVTYSPDSKQLALANSDGTVGIWDTASFQAVTQLKGHTGAVNSVAYSPDGKQLASASEDKTIFLWTKQITACLAESQENWQLIRRFESSHALSAKGAFLKGANISENNLALLKQKGANNDQDIQDHAHLDFKANV